MIELGFDETTKIISAIPVNVREILEKPENTGLFIAGGFCRDVLSDIKPKDIDVYFNRNPFAELAIMPIEFPIDVVVTNKKINDVLLSFDYIINCIAVQWSGWEWTGYVLTYNVRRTLRDKLLYPIGQVNLYRHVYLMMKGYKNPGMEYIEQGVVEAVKKSIIGDLIDDDRLFEMLGYKKQITFAPVNEIVTGVREINLENYNPGAR